jgi:hypothetical protein
MTIESNGVVIEALGISVGDKIWCPYDKYDKSNPIYYRVKRIYGPYWYREDICFVIWPYPVISLGLEYWNRKVHGQPGINNIHKDGDRWFDDHGYELFVEKKNKSRYVAIDLFSSLTKNKISAYKFNPELDYSDPDKIFKCQSCGFDFNGELVNNFVTPYCSVCGFKGGVSRKIIIMEKVIPGQKYWGAYQRMMGYTGRPEGTMEFFS